MSKSRSKGESSCTDMILRRRRVTTGRTPWYPPSGAGTAVAMIGGRYDPHGRFAKPIVASRASARYGPIFTGGPVRRRVLGPGAAPPYGLYH